MQPLVDLKGRKGLVVGIANDGSIACGLPGPSTPAAPQRRLATVDEVGATAAFLESDAAKSVTGSVAFVDGGYNIVH